MDARGAGGRQARAVREAAVPDRRRGRPDRRRSRATCSSSRRAGTAGTRGSAWPSSTSPTSARCEHVSAGFAFAGAARGQLPARARRGAAGRCTTSGTTPSALSSGLSAGDCPTTCRARSALAARPEWTCRPRRSWTGTAATAEVRAGIDEGLGQWLVITGDRGEIELRDAPFTSWKDDATELWVSRRHGHRADRGTRDGRLPGHGRGGVVGDPGGPGWVLPLGRVPADRRLPGPDPRRLPLGRLPRMSEHHVPNRRAERMGIGAVRRQAAGHASTSCSAIRTDEGLVVPSDVARRRAAGEAPVRRPHAAARRRATARSSPTRG